MSSKVDLFLRECWSEHAEQTEAVAAKLAQSLALCETQADAERYCWLIVHVIGGHQGQWHEAISLLGKLVDNPLWGDCQSLQRGLATLAYCSGDHVAYATYLAILSDENSELRVLAAAAAELTTAGNAEAAMVAFTKALALAPVEISQGNPVAKLLAVSGNNLACELEEKTERSEQDVALMLKAAQAARKYWEIAGGWIEIERAEYRLAMSHLEANLPKQALAHAELCAKICRENNADNFEMFFVHQVLVKCHRAMCEQLKASLPEKDQAWCQVP